MASVARAHVAMFGDAAVSGSAAVPAVAGGGGPGAVPPQEPAPAPVQRLHWTSVRNILPPPSYPFISLMAATQALTRNVFAYSKRCRCGSMPQSCLPCQQLITAAELAPAE